MGRFARREVHPRQPIAASDARPRRVLHIDGDKDVVAESLHHRRGVGPTPADIPDTMQAGAVDRHEADLPRLGWLRDIEDTIAVFPLKTADDVIDQMSKIISQFDIVVADGPAGLSEVTRALLLVADLALLPCGPSALDLRAAQDAIRVVQQAQMIRKGPPKTFLLPNKVQSNYRLSRELLETADTLGIPSLKALKLRQSYADAAGQGTVVWRLPGTKEVSEEINELFNQIGQYEKEIAYGSRVA